jgi:hypothetical protein
LAAAAGGSGRGVDSSIAAGSGSELLGVSEIELGHDPNNNPEESRSTMERMLLVRLRRVENKEVCARVMCIIRVCSLAVYYACTVSVVTFFFFFSLGFGADDDR